MKKILFIFILFSYSISNAQIVNIPDANFKYVLLHHNPKIDINNDGEIQISEANNYSQYLEILPNNTIYDMTGIEYFININFMIYSDISISKLDLSKNIKLGSIFSGNNHINTLDVNSLNLIAGDGFYCDNNNLDTLILENTTVNWFRCSHNNLTFIDLSNTIIENELDCSFNLLTSIDVSNSPNLTTFSCSNNPNLTYINLNNGNNKNFSYTWSHFKNLPNLETVCVDDIEYTKLTEFITNQVGHPVTFTQSCSSNGENEINGNIRYDKENNGCDDSDLPLNNFMVVATGESDYLATFSNKNGEYKLSIDEGDYSIKVATSLPDYFTIIPDSLLINIESPGPVTPVDFCVSSNQSVKDLNIALYPLNQARSGFNSQYRMIYKNIGTEQVNGNINLKFDDSKMKFLSSSYTYSSQSSNSITFDFSELEPFELRIINLDFNILAPPTVNIGDNIELKAIVNPTSEDITPDDNIFILNQTIIGSYDPNDIVILEGEEIRFHEIGEELHYIIRFQNTGTAQAQNVKVINVLDDKLDWQSLKLESTSHNCNVIINNGKTVDFVFDNINLPDSISNEEASHGFIIYKIKPKTTVKIGDIISNSAEIFFDFNEAVKTNTVTTRISANMSIITEKVDVSCFEACDGSIIVPTINNGYPPYIFNWSNGDTKNNKIESLCAGDYYLTITDAKDYTVIDTFTITQPNEIIITIDSLRDVRITPLGYIAISTNDNDNYTFSWYGPNNYLSFDEDAFDLGAYGCYTVTITDTITNCSIDSTICLKNKTSTFYINDITSNIDLYPNPTSKDFILDFNRINLQQAKIKLYDLSGKIIIELDKKANERKIKFNIEKFNSSLYIIQIQTENYGTIYKKVFINK